MNKVKILNVLKNIAAVVVLLALFTLIYYQNRDHDILSRESAEKTESASSSDKPAGIFEGYTGGDICTLGDNVAVITTDTYSVIDVNGDGKTQNITMSNPVIHSDGDFALYYNKTDKEAFVYKRDKKRYSIKTENRIINAKAAGSGYSIVVTEKEGYNSEVMVYDVKGDAAFKWDISESEFLDADIDSVNSNLVISTVAAEEGRLIGQIIMIDMSEAKIIRKESFSSEVFYNVKMNKNGTFTALGSDRLAYFNRSGSLKWSVKYENQTLIKADITNPNNMVLAFSAAGSGIKGASTYIEVIDRLGAVAAKKTISGIANDVRIGSSIIGVAIGKNVYIMDTNLKNEKKLVSETSVKKIAFFGDGKHVFVLGNSGGTIMQ